MGVSWKRHLFRLTRAIQKFFVSCLRMKLGIPTDMARGSSSSLLRDSCGSVHGEFSDARWRLRRRIRHYEQWLTVRFWEEMSCLRKWIFTFRPKIFRDWLNLLLLNLFTMIVAIASGIFMFESSDKVLQESFGTTILFPMYFPHALALAISAKYEKPTFLGNFAGFYVGRIYAAWRAEYVISLTRTGVLLAASAVGVGEVSAIAFFLRRCLCRQRHRKIPSIESIREALQFVVTVTLSSLAFETLIALVICTSPVVSWSNFFSFWGSNWLGVLAGMLTVSPAAMHFLAWRPRQSLLRPRKICEAIGLTVITSGVVVIMFITNIQAVIRPLPYLLFPIIILTAFRFNRLGCALVVMIICYICSWASVRGRGAVYRMAGSPIPRSSPKLILQVELFVAVLGMVGILLAAAVREKKKLARDLVTMNEELETTVSQRTRELVQANEELKESQRKAEEASQAKSDFLANMSHEIRTPIHGIMGLTAILLDSELSADQRESLLSVKECANLLLHIINSILDLAKIEAGRVEVESVPFNVRKLVSSTVCMLTTRARDRQLDLLWEVDSTVPEWMVGDSGKIQQCLLNLVGNAVKFTHEGSVAVQVSVDMNNGMSKWASPRLTLEFEDQPKALSSRLTQSTTSLLQENTGSTAITIFENPLDQQCCSEEKNHSNLQILQNGTVVGQGSVYGIPVLFEVRDTGIGISSTKLQDIFTPFTQADASTSRVYGGTGLGLCIVQRFVELLGGKLLAESELGRGSTFKFCIPLGSSETQTGESNSVDSKGDIPALSQPSPDTHVERQKSGTLGPSPSFPKDEGGDDEEVASLDFAAEQDLAKIKALGSSKDYTLSIDSSSNKYTVPDGDTNGGEQGEAATTWAPLQSWISLEKWDSVPGDWNKSFRQESRSNAGESHIPRSISEDLNKSSCQSGFSPITTKKMDASQPTDGESHSPLQQPAQTAKPQFFVKDTPLKCSVTVQSDNRSNRDEEGYRSSMPDNAIYVVDTKVPSFESQKQHLSRSEIKHKEIGTIHQSLQAKNGKNIGVMDDGWQKNRKLHVLLAEDNLINQKVATRQLQKHGHTVTVVGDGVGALDSVIANHDSFDLVLMDVQMPIMDGLEATKRIREEEIQQGCKRLPILGLTAHAIQGYEHICLSSGMDGYLGKPFDINQLLQVIDKYLLPLER